MCRKGKQWELVVLERVLSKGQSTKKHKRGKAGSTINE
jgi:hypothetical protein